MKHVEYQEEKHLNTSNMEGERKLRGYKAVVRMTSFVGERFARILVAKRISGARLTYHTNLNKISRIQVAF